MSDNIVIRDSSGSNITLRSTETGGIQVPHHIVDSFVGPLPAGSNVIGSVNLANSIPSGGNTIGMVGIIGTLPSGSNQLGSVSIQGSVPAGTNTIGFVSLTGSIPAGSNTIGSVVLAGGASTIGNVGITTALPAGSNNIGSVNIATALPAGSNTIGNVGISVALPAGSNTIGNVGLVSSIPAGANTIGNVGVVTSIPAGTNNIGTVGGTDDRVTVVPTVQAAAYSAGNDIGGLMSFTLPRTASGILNTIMLKFVGGATTPITVYVFDSNPTVSTFTDRGGFTLATADLDRLVCAPQLLTPVVSGNGTLVSFQEATNLGRMFKSTGTIYIACVSGGTFTPGSTTDMHVSIQYDLNVV